MRYYIPKHIPLLLLCVAALVAPAASSGSAFAAAADSSAASEALYELSYDDATAYYRAPVTVRRRALDWWVAGELFNSSNTLYGSLDTPYDERDRARRIRLSGSTTRYVAGLSANYYRDFGGSTSSGSSFDAAVNMQGGPDMMIDGVSRYDVTTELSLSHAFASGSALTLSLRFPLLHRTLQSGATAEAFAMTGNNLYNPAWGVDEGQLRSARTSKYMIPELSMSYDTAIGVRGATRLRVELTGEWGVRGVTGLGWYEGENPMPNYYRNMPSYATSEQYDIMAGLWSDADLDTTQISWSRLRDINEHAPDGVSNYYVEWQMERRLEATLSALFTSHIDVAGGELAITYGAEGSGRSNRLYKQMDDLLGGSHYLDLDSYIGDESHAGTSYHNNLLAPDRQILQGDRFGYDYSRSAYTLRGVVGLSYDGWVGGALQGSLVARLGEQTAWRVGHYEKERFASGLSLAASQRVAMQDSRLRLSLSYEPSAGREAISRQRISFSGSCALLPISSRDLFLQEQSANRVIASPTSERLLNFDLGYSATVGRLSLSAVAFYTSSRDRTQVWQYYDDLSYTYCDAVISAIAMDSYGVELAARYMLLRRVTFDMTLAAGRYEYVGTPVVTLYDNSDMSYVATTTCSVAGCVVGNTPQLLATAGVLWRIAYGFNLYINCAYAGSRYAEPSMLRRTDRLLGSEDLGADVAAAISLQERLDPIFDLSMSLYKSFTVGGRTMAINATAANLLGDRSRVNYAREANRLFGGSTLQGSTYTYGVGRSFQLSCSYNF